MHKSSLILSRLGKLSVGILCCLVLLQGRLFAFPAQQPHYPHTLFTSGLHADLGEEPKEEKAQPQEAYYLQTLLGAEFEALSFEEAQEMELMGGVMIKKIISGPLSQQSFMEEGFVITKVNGEEVFTIRRLYNVLKKNPQRIHFEGKYNDLLMEYDNFRGNYTYLLLLHENW